MGGRNAVGTPSGARRGLADGKIALGLQSQTSARQAARLRMIDPRQPVPALASCLYVLQTQVVSLFRQLVPQLVDTQPSGD